MIEPDYSETIHLIAWYINREVNAFNSMQYLHCSSRDPLLKSRIQR